MSYSDSIIEAMATLVGDALAKQKNTKVIEADIDEIIDPTIGLYSLNYLDISIKAYSNNISTQYAKDDRVYVLSKDGTLDGDLIIIGATMPYSGLYDDSNKIQYRPICDNIFIDINNGQTIELCTYQSPQNIDNIELNYGVNFNAIFNRYLNKYKTFCLSMNVRTAIEDPYQKVNGNYGIKLTIPMIRVNENGEQEEVDIEYIFDIEKMEGNPYEMTISTPQSIYYKFDDNLTYNVNKTFTLSAFCKDFRKDDAINTPDIFLNNIKFFPVEVIDASILAGNYLMLTATQGNYFVNDRFSNTKVITPTLFVDGNEVSIKGLDTYWFVEDGSITTSSKLYNNKGGTGWRCLNKYSKQETIDGAVESVLDLTQQTLEVSKTDVVTSLRYKCVIIYNNDLVKQELLIENLNSNVDISLEIDPSFVVSTSEVNVDCKVIYKDDVTLGRHYLKYIWTRYDSEAKLIDSDFYSQGEKYNNFTQLDEHTIQYETNIHFAGSIIEDNYNVIVCSIFDVDPLDNSMQMIGTVQKLIALNSAKDFYLSMTGSNKLYKYDSDGDSPMVANYDGPISSIIHEIEPISFEIYKSDGNKLTQEEKDWCLTTWSLPKNSMMTFGINKFKEQGLDVSEDELFYYITKRGIFDISYDIANSYNASKTNNAVSVKVAINDNSQTVLTGTADIRFLKEGENGTNGTRFSALLTYQGYGYNVINEYSINNKLQLIYIAETNEEGTETGNGKWYYKAVDDNLISSLKEVPATGISYNNKPTFGVEVYKDGELIDTTTSYSVDWFMFDEQITKPYFTIDKISGILKPATENAWAITSDIRAIVVQANIKVSDSSITSSDQIIYAYFPIEMSRLLDTDVAKMIYVPTIEGGFDTVLYSTDGTNPKYDTTYPFKYNNSLSNDSIEDIYSYYWGGSSNLSVKQDKEKEFISKATPVPKYDNGRANNYIFARMMPTETAIEPKIKEHQEILNNLLKDIAKNIIQYEELKNLTKDFSWSYSSEEAKEKEENAKADINKYSTEVINANEKIIAEDEDYNEIMNSLYQEDFEASIDNIESNLNSYVTKMSLALRNTFDNITVYDIDKNTQEDYIYYLDSILKIQNPIKNSISYISLEDAIDICYNTIENDWNKLYNKNTSDEIDILLDRAKALPLDANFQTDFENIENQIINIDSSYKGLLDEIKNLSIAQIARLDTERSFYLTINNLINGYLNQFNNNLSVAESNLPINYKEITSESTLALYDNNGTFVADIQKISEYNNKIIERDTYIEEHNNRQTANKENLKIANDNLTKAEKDYAACLSARVSELKTWNDNLVYNDFLFSREKCITYITKALNDLELLNKAFIDAKIEISVYDYEVKIASLKDKIYKALKEVYSTIADTDIATVSDLTDAILILLDDEKNNIANTLAENNDIQGNITINEHINNYNDNINGYNEEYKTLITKDTSKVQYIYQKINNFYNKDSFYLTNTPDVDYVQNFLASFGIDATLDIAKVISDYIVEINGNETAFSAIKDLVSADDDYKNFETSLDTLLKSYYCDTKEKWNDLYLNDKEISGLKDYQDLILKVFFDIIKVYYKIGLNGVEITSCTLDSDGETLALTDKYNNIPKNILQSFNTEIKEEIDNLKILKYQLSAITNKISAFHVKPIVFRLNTYEFSWLNDWDGNKLHIDENGEYIVAPQIGAGVKDEANQFTGITMGVKYTKDKINSQVGLFGFSHGKQSIFLDAKTGKAEFGINRSGQISIDPTQNRALLYSGDFFERNTDGEINYNRETGKGLLIDLTTPEIRFGSGGFWVDKDGNMHVGGTGEGLVVPAPAPAQPTEIIIKPTYIEGKGWIYNDGYTQFNYIEESGLYVDTIGNVYNYDSSQDVFMKDGNTYQIVSSVTSGEESILRKKVNGEYVYYYYNGSKTYELISISGMYKADITKKGFGSSSYTTYFDATQNTYWYVSDENKIIFYLNDDEYGKYVRWNENKKVYYFYNDDDTIVEFFYDKDLNVYVTYDATNGYFFFIDGDERFTPPGKEWIWDSEQNAYFYWGDDGSRVWMKKDSSSLGGWRIGEDSIYSENKKMKIYSAFGAEDANPAIFASPSDFDKHSTLESITPGCYLGPDGLSIGDALRATNDKGVFIGKLTNSSSSKKYWRIYGSNNNSYIYYNAKNTSEESDDIDFLKVATDEEEVTQKNKIYIGTDGVIIGNEFQIDIDGLYERKEAGMIYIGNLEEHVYWRFHTARGRAYMFSDKADRGEGNAKLSATEGQAHSSVYVGTDGIRVGVTSQIGTGEGNSFLGYLPNPSGRWAIGWNRTEEKPEPYDKDSWFYVNKYNDRGNFNSSDTDVSLNLAKVSPRNYHDIYIGTNGIRIGKAFRVDDMIGERDHFVVRIMKEDFYLGERNSDGTITWELFSGGGGGGSLPMAEAYSF